MSIPLSSIDNNFIALDSSTTQQVIALVGVLQGTPCKEEILQRAQEITDKIPLLKSKISYSPSLSWIPDAAFDFYKHIIFVDTLKNKTEKEILTRSSLEFSKKLGLDRPPWKLVVVGDFNSPTSKDTFSTAMLILHHAFADGIGGMQVFNAFCGIRLKKTATIEQQKQSAAGRFGSQRNLFKSIWQLLKEVFASTRTGPLNGKNSSERLISTFDIDLGMLKGIRRAKEVTLNELMLSIVTRGLQMYYNQLHYPLENLNAVMPISTRTRDQINSLGNKLTAVGVILPLVALTKHEQISRIKHFLGQIKTSGAYGAYSLFAQVNRRLPRSWQHSFTTYAARKTNFICTSVPASARPLNFAGAPMIRHYGIAALMQGHGIAFGFTRYAKKMCLSIVSDPQIVAQPEALLECVQKAVREYEI